jgi:serine/threonine-protein kinase
MGVVWLGHHVELEQPVAIKFLRPKLAQGETVIARFLNEAKAAAAMRSEHVVRVMDVGQLGVGQAYMVMEHLEGIDLEALLRQEGPLDVARVVDYVLQACRGLVEAHSLGIIHRDIKPENLFLTRRPDREIIKLVDFGLAKRLDVEHEWKLTGPQEFMGSPGYMSPEQMTSPHEVDARTDIWSLGIVLYQLLSGTLPFNGSTVVEVCAQVLHATPQPLSELRADVNAALNAVVFRCLEKSPDQRYPSVADFAAELERYGSPALSDTQPVWLSPLVKVAPSEHPALSKHPALSEPALSDAAPSDLEDFEPKTAVRSRSALVVALFSLACGAVGAYAADRMGWVQLRDIAGGMFAPATPGEARKPNEGSRVDALSPPFVGAASSRGVEPGARDESKADPAADAAESAAGPTAGTSKTPAQETAPGAVSSSSFASERTQTSKKDGPADDSEALSPAERERRYREYLEREGFRPLREVLKEEGIAPSSPYSDDE